MRFPLLCLIIFYQKYLSPKKGFICAYGALHKNGSCSEMIYEIVKTKPFYQLPRLIINQFRNCSLAYQTFNSLDEDRLNSGRCVLLPRKTKKDNEDDDEKGGRKFSKCEYAIGGIACCISLPFDI